MVACKSLQVSYVRFCSTFRRPALGVLGRCYCEGSVFFCLGFGGISGARLGKGVGRMARLAFVVFRAGGVLGLERGFGALVWH